MIWTKQPIKTSIEEINDKVVGDYFSVSSLSDLETRLSSIGDSMDNHSQRPVSFYFDGASAPFTNDRYVGIMTRTYANRYQIKLNQSALNYVIAGTKNSSGWVWDSLALSSELTPSGLKNGNIDTYFKSDVCWIQSKVSSGTQPDFTYYQLEIIPNGNGQIVQRATRLGTSATAIRIYANGAWSAWQELATKSSVDTLNSKFVNVDTVAISEITSTHTINENTSSANRFGRVVHLRLSIKTTSAVSEFGTILTLPASLRPLTQFIGFMMNGNYAPVAFDITYAGALRIWASVASGVDLSLDITYFAQ